jgi:hypothetical protein
MRLGEFKQIVDRALLDDNRLQLNARTLYEGQAYVVTEFAQLYAALQLLIEQTWNNIDHDAVDTVLTKYKGTESAIQLTVSDFNTLSGYISTLNQQLPIAMSVVDAWVPLQDQYIINIKLPDNIDSISSLEAFNKRLNRIFKVFNITGKFEFKGFDSGTDWYQIQVTTHALYQYIMAAIVLALAVVKLKSNYYKSETDRLAYKAAKRKDEKLTEENYVCEIAETKIEDDTKEMVGRLGVPDGREPQEMTAMTIKAVNELVKELGNGTEFHLSLNPPNYLSESTKDGSLTIDYKSMPKIEKPVKDVAVLKDGKMDKPTADEKMVTNE